MSKSILVIDTPERCCQCKFSGSDGDYCCLKENLIADGNMISEEEYLNKKPNWCPLLDFPKKTSVGIEVCIGNKTDCVKSYVDGYNACIDEILKGGEAE